MVPIKKALDRIPGGLMIVPLFIGALVHTIWPDAGLTLGSFTNGLMTGSVPILAVWFVCLGATIKVRNTGTVLRKSGTLLITKVAVAWILAFIFSHVVPGGNITTGFFAGLSVLALVAAMDMTNTGLYASLMNQYGTKEESGAFVLMNLESGPLMTMIILGTAGIASFNPVVLIGMILPFLIGFLIGNLDPKMSDLLGGAVTPLIPFFAFALGSGISLTVIAETGLMGIMLGIFVIIITGIPLILCDLFVGGGRGTAGVAASSTAGAAAATPALVAAAVPAFAPFAEQATALVATSVLVTAIGVPIVTGLWAKNCMRIGLVRGVVERREAKQAAKAAAASTAAAA
ncbi:MAG: 2-keto-3-deoxygluconate permease [Propionibacteriaceae bacterium]|jgi:2-keto-3-deoxygluconate permease|nr:2-keto-3-deoxygluconate permease [Propionibacteriaceae bacterium]